MSMIYHKNGKTAWNGVIAYHENGKTAWNGVIAYHDNGKTAWNGVIAYHNNGKTAWNGVIAYHDNGQTMGYEGTELELGTGIRIQAGKKGFNLYIFGNITVSKPK